MSSIIFLNACALSPIKNDSATPSDIQSTNKVHSQYQLLLASLLDEVDVNDFSYTTQQGVNKFDQLKHFKALEQIYVSSIEKIPNHNNLTIEQLKTLLFFSFYAQHKNSAAFLEYLAADLMVVYNSQSTQVLKLLNNYPFLVAANCNRLNAYFGFEGKNITSKPSFLAANRSLILQYLSKKRAQICLDEFE